MTARKTQLSVLEEIEKQVSGTPGAANRKTIDVLENINANIGNLAGGSEAITESVQRAEAAAETAENSAEAVVSAVENAAKLFKTEVLMRAQTTPQVDKQYRVYADPDPAKNGTWVWDGTDYVGFEPSTRALSQLIGQEVGPHLDIQRDAIGKHINIIASNGQQYTKGMSGLSSVRPPDMLHPLGYAGRQSFKGIEVPFSAGGTYVPYALPDDWAAEAKKYMLIMPTGGMSIAGGATDNSNDPVLTPTALYPNNAFMPSTGRYCIGESFDSLVPLHETSTGVIRESSSSGMVYKFLELCQEKVGFMPMVTTFCASRGGRSWPRHKPGNEMMEFFEIAMRGTVLGCERMGLIPIVISFIHFGLIADRTTPRMSKEASKSSIINMEKTIDNSVRLHTGQTFRFPKIVYQPTNAAPIDGYVPGYALAPLELDGHGDIRCGSSKIWIEPSNQGPNTGVHWDSVSYRSSGYEDGRDIFEEIAGTGLQAFQIVRHRWVSDTTFDLFYNPRDSEIMIDTSNEVVITPTWPGSIAGVQFFDYPTTLDSAGKVVAAETSQTVKSLTVVKDADTSGTPKIILRVELYGRPTGPWPRVHIGTRNDGSLDPSNPDEDALLNNSGRKTGARSCIRTTSTPTKWAPIQMCELGVPPLTIEPV